MNPIRSAAVRRQQGATLIVALIFLAILALLGVTVAQTTQLEERMASNTRDRDLALQATEAALSWAGVNMAALSAAAPQLNTALGNNAAYWSAYNWAGSSTQLTGANITVNGLATYPQLVVQRRGGVPPPGTSANYRVTARGVGATSNAVVILQAEYVYP